jgi:hypothetical protein
MALNVEVSSSHSKKTTTIKRRPHSSVGNHRNGLLLNVSVTIKIKGLVRYFTSEKRRNNG